MCNPTAIAIGQMAMTAIGGMMQMQAQKAQAQFQAAQMQQQAKIAEYNRTVAENDAIAAMQWAEVEADAVDYRKRRVAAEAQTLFAKGGVVINQDTPLKIAEDIELAGVEDRLKVLYAGEQKAAAARSRGYGYTLQAQNYEMSAKNAIESGKLAQYSTTIKTGKSLLDAYPT